ncbi:MAG: hypothetical protein ABIP93_05040 [Gemmatimonadaceae bacterium]
MQPSPRTYRAFLVALMMLTASAFQSARSTLEVAGELTLVTSSAGPGRDARGRDAWISGATGSNRSTGKSEFMNRAAVVTADTSLLVAGTGPHQGTITMADGANRLICAWRGRVTTVMGADGTPRSTSVGTWTVLSSSGRYAGATGRGTYTGRYASSTTSVMEWAGMITP